MGRGPVVGIALFSSLWAVSAWAQACATDRDCPGELVCEQARCVSLGGEAPAVPVPPPAEALEQPPLPPPAPEVAAPPPQSAAPPGPEYAPPPPAPEYAPPPAAPPAYATPPPPAGGSCRWTSECGEGLVCHAYQCMRQVPVRGHDPTLMIVGGSMFGLSFGTAIGMSVALGWYNANAARVGPIPLFGPFLAAAQLADEDYEEGWGLVMNLGGLMQWVGVGLAGFGYFQWARGYETDEMEYLPPEGATAAPSRSFELRPSLIVLPGGLHLGAEVVF